jgi:hypothetical protein
MIRHAWSTVARGCVIPSAKPSNFERTLPEPLEAEMAEDKDQIQISVRMPADLVSALERRAEEEDRTLSAEIRRIARRAIVEEAA